MVLLDRDWIREGALGISPRHIRPIIPAIVARLPSAVLENLVTAFFQLLLALECTLSEIQLLGFPKQR